MRELVADPILPAKSEDDVKTHLDVSGASGIVPHPTALHLPHTDHSHKRAPPLCSPGPQRHRKAMVGHFSSEDHVHLPLFRSLAKSLRDDCHFIAYIGCVTGPGCAEYRPAEADGTVPSSLVCPRLPWPHTRHHIAPMQEQRGGRERRQD